MKIHLKNFRCYTDKTFDFEELKLTLLHGISGNGKTSILMAIHFALFDEGKKLQSFGKTSCEVEIIFPNMTIKRKKTPNNLFLTMDGKTYEDDAAQAIINQEFGTSFNIISYISQGGEKSFINMKPAEKLEFLESIAFKDTNLSEINERIKNHIKKTSETIQHMNGKISMITQNIEEMSIPDIIPFPLKDENQEEAIEKENINGKVIIKTIKSEKNEINVLEQEASAVTILNDIISSKQETLDNINADLEKLSKKKFKESDEELLELRNTLENMIKYREFITLCSICEATEKKLNEMKVAEDEDRKQKILSIEKTLWKKKSKNILENLIEKKRKEITSLNRLNELKKKKEKNEVSEDAHSKNKRLLEDKKELAKQKDIYKCPSCNESLRFIDEKLVVSNIELTCDNIPDNIDDLIKNYEKTIDADEKKINKCSEYQIEIDEIKSLNIQQSLEEIENDVNLLDEELRKNLVLENQLELLKLGSVSKSIRITENDVKTMKKQIEIFDTPNQKFLESEDDIRKKIDVLSDAKKEADFNKKQSETKNREKKMIEAQILKKKSEHEEKFGEIRSLDETILEKKRILVDLETKYEAHLDIMKLIDIFKNNEVVRKKYETQVAKKADMLKEFDIVNKKYAAAICLQSKISESKSIALANLIDLINNHAKVYLDSFFIDHPISVILLAFKESKTTQVVKPNINIQIEYKGIEADTTMLSGGEMCRVILAFTLALGEIFNTKILMLDESTSSLDQELTTNVFNCIRENFNNRTIIVVAHQIIQGIFDNIITI